MTEETPQSFMYEHCDVPAGVALTEWRHHATRPDRRRAQVTGGLLAAIATLAPIVLSVRGSRQR
jgi:hypothetical protein